MVQCTQAGGKGVKSSRCPIFFACQTRSWATKPFSMDQIAHLSPCTDDSYALKPGFLLSGLFTYLLQHQNSVQLIHIHDFIIVSSPSDLSPLFSNSTLKQRSKTLPSAQSQFNKTEYNVGNSSAMATSPSARSIIISTRVSDCNDQGDAN
jgi:hypothetical protein